MTMGEYNRATAADITARTELSNRATATADYTAGLDAGYKAGYKHGHAEGYAAGQLRGELTRLQHETRCFSCDKLLGDLSIYAQDRERGNENGVFIIADYVFCSPKCLSKSFLGSKG